ncbi:MAG: hypothetical protein LBT33_01135, partial [Spirochaetia bacterium]|jgi:hypothetical protein|nr:hypothetical protein [Spirochaetia bacterium]
MTVSGTYGVYIVGVVAGISKNAQFSDIEISAIDSTGALDVATASPQALLFIGAIAGLCEGGNTSLINCGSGLEVKGSSAGSQGLIMGGLSGIIQGGVTKSYSTGKVSGKTTATGGEIVIGGLFGTNDAAITNCYATGAISVDSSDDVQAGGLVGNNNVNIQNSYATGNISGSAQGSVQAGGLTGESDGNSVIEKCYAKGNINITSAASTYQVGGIVGALGESETINTITKSAALNGSLSGGGSNIHRVVGSLYNNDVLTSNIANSAMMGGGSDKTANGKDGLDKNSIEIASQETYTALGWDFTNIWEMSGGYPVLRWQ